MFKLTEKQIANFWSRVVKLDGGCWEANIGLIKGYPYFNISGKGYRLNIGGNRLSWYLHNGDIPEGLFVCHKCDNRKCVNPDHLFLGTHQDNMDDMVEKGRAKSPCSDSEKQQVMVLKAETPEAILKKKATFAKIGHSKGAKNSQFGMMWVTNGTESRKIMKDSVIPEGWYKGRKM